MSMFSFPGNFGIGGLLGSSSSSSLSGYRDMTDEERNRLYLQSVQNAAPLTATMAAQLQNAYSSSSAAQAAARLANQLSTLTMSSTTTPGSFVDYEDRQNPTAGSALLGSSSGKFVLLVDNIPAEYPNPSLEDSFGVFAKWRISTSSDGQVICSGHSFLILPLMIVDALNAKVTRDDVRSIKIAKEL
jgi:hypothetical protein